MCIQRKFKSWIGKFCPHHSSKVQFQYQPLVPSALVSGIGIAPCFRDSGGIFQSMILIFVGFPQFLNIGHMSNFSSVHTVQTLHHFFLSALTTEFVFT